MHFTIVGKDFTMTANFWPCLVWSFATEHPDQDHLWNQHPDHPCYDEGDLQKAMGHFRLKNSETSSVILVVHAGAQKAQQDDFERIKSDCEKLFSSIEILNPWQTCSSK